MAVTSIPNLFLCSSLVYLSSFVLLMTSDDVLCVSTFLDLWESLRNRQENGNIDFETGKYV